MTCETGLPRVHIELLRVQTWLFAVPRLRAMVGANALLAETLRVTLPALARETGRGWTLASAPEHDRYPIADPDDPLAAYDNPAADAKDGILARDGGHFLAVFANGAEAFADAATQHLRSNLPGLPFRITISGKLHTRNLAHLPTELPAFAPCPWTGRGLASHLVRQGGEFHEVSLAAKQRHDTSRKVEKGQSSDLASLLLSKTKLSVLERPLELQELVDNGYLALIHADGNDLGRGLGKDSTDSQRARFYHRNRVLLRRALARAIDEVCASDEAPQPISPLVPLMLGGDDLLLVCRAEIALPFVVSLCKALEDLQTARNDFKLTLGIGVVIARHTVPIHRLHEVAAQLAGSAKRRYRGLGAEEKCSVVDWAVFTTAWVDNPEDVRRRDWLRCSENEFRILSQRPVNVLGNGLTSLQGLVAAAQDLKVAPRSQLRYLVDQLPRGRMLSELAFTESPSTVKASLSSAGVTSLWRRVGDAWITALLDLIEIAEISRLGRNSGRAAVGQEAVHA